MELRIDSGLVLKCRGCDMAFILSAKEAKWFASRQLNLPSHCPLCRQLRKGMAHTCETCFHLVNGLCDCREPEDIRKQDCPDWRPK